jgi:DNA-binding transcriptional MerR regulator
MKRYCISELGRRFGLSRSTLLYYDRIGLLRPSGRSGADYRQYSEDDVQRMERICLFRGSGLS